MTKPLKNRARLTSTLSNDINNKFTELNNLTRIPKSRLLDEALSDLIKKYSQLWEKNHIDK